jgi:ATP-dependent helicase HepA
MKEPDTQEFAPGQRWLSAPEADLGLGLVAEVSEREVVIFFPGCGEERRYARHNAPLTRFVHNEGDTLETAEGTQLIVSEVDDSDGVVVYHAHEPGDADEQHEIPESRLAHHLALSTAADRLFARQLDKPRWFELRYEALRARQILEGSPVLGLRGPRIELIPHQLYIAREVASRFAPRVLLADEVGLGKTIEAGLVVHQQLVSERARRVLLVVPDHLIHQWYVEMARRFNIHFSIFDASRIQALREEEEALDEAALDALSGLGPDEDAEAPDEGDDADSETADTSGDDDIANPFLSEQYVLMGQQTLVDCDPDQLTEAEWDLLVVDEAHHLEWQPDAPGETYSRVESLADRARGVLLLTATPEQLGRAGHFAQLRLLDPERFSSLDAFIEEQQHFEELAELAQALEDQSEWDAELKKRAAGYLPDTRIDEDNRETVVRELIDRHGTGRVMFRNTRARISGFPERHVNGVALPRPEGYAEPPADAGETACFPESAFSDDSWCRQDPRVEWLTNFLREHRREKVLVICARKETATDLHAWLGYRQGLNVGLFHEDMDLISRDRTAAYFADHEDGARALICSEIGSEGRNFQFCRHLVLLDLPTEPDLLEQRIGRLDRIGQHDTIEIHVPYLDNHGQSVLFDWYHQGMKAFETPNPVGHLVRERTRQHLEQALQAPANSQAREALIDESARVTAELHANLAAGRDRLLELNSHDPEAGDQLVAQLRAADAEPPTAFMDQVCERFGVEVEEHSENARIFMAGPRTEDAFPGLPDEGVTVTADRATALARDDMQFLSWEHPMVTGAMQRVLDRDQGKASVALLKNPSVPAGTLLVESLHVLEPLAPRELQAGRYLPPVVIRTLTDAHGKDLSHAISHAGLSRQCSKMDKPLARKVIDSQKDKLRELLAEDEARVQEEVRQHIEQALEALRTEQQQEIDRLRALQQKNPAIRDEEIDHLRHRSEALEAHVREAPCRLEGVRVIVAGEK